MLPPLLGGGSQPISKVGTEGAYDQIKVCEALAGGQITPLIPLGVKRYYGLINLGTS